MSNTVAQNWRYRYIGLICALILHYLSMGLLGKTPLAMFLHVLRAHDTFEQRLSDCS